MKCKKKYILFKRMQNLCMYLNNWIPHWNSYLLRQLFDSRHQFPMERWIQLGMTIVQENFCIAVETERPLIYVDDLWIW